MQVGRESFIGQREYRDSGGEIATWFAAGTYANLY
jgi:hypothetical protein